MSVEIPKMAAAFGNYSIPQADIIECRIHLGCTKEVSSFELLLQNWDGKYSPGGSIPLAVGMDGHIDIGRGTNVPQIITCRIETIKHESTPTEHYTRVSGRCWGERLFRRVFTGAFWNMKGESIVRWLLDHYVGLSHNRDGTELVENTDTTYTWLEYENTPVWDIIKYIAESADKNGVVGYDFRVAPDGKFEFFPKNSKTSSVDLSNQIEISEYAKKIERVRNKIRVLGANEKKLPTDPNEDGLTEEDDDWIPYWGHNIGDTTDHVTKDGDKQYTDNYAIRVFMSVGSQVRDKIGMYRYLPSQIKVKEQDGFKRLRFWIKWHPFRENINPTSIKVRLETDADNYYYKELLYDLVNSKDSWRKIESSLEEYWAPVGNPNWANINRIGFTIEFPEPAGQYEYAWFFVDHIVFENCRYSATVEDTTSQNLYGLRELSETDEELLSDYECLLRARALLAHLKDPADYIVLRSTVLDYGDTPILPGDKIYVELPNEGVSGYYRIETVEYFVDAKNQTLEVTLELGKAPPLLADYLYGLRSTTVTVEKLARTKLGKGAIPSLTRSVGYFYHDHTGEIIQPDHVNTENLSVYRDLSDTNPQIILTKDDQQKPFIQFGQGSVNQPDIWLKRLENNTLELKTQYLWPKVGNFLEIGSSNLDEYNNPKTVGKIYVSSLLLPSDGFLHIISFTEQEQQPRARLTQDSLAFGPGGETVPDTWLKRLAANQFECSGDIIPDYDNARSLGVGGEQPKRWKELRVIDLYVSNSATFNCGLIPEQDNTYDLGAGYPTNKRWRNLYVAGYANIGALNAGNTLPLQNDTYDLGTEGTCWRNLWLSGYIKALLGFDTHVKPSTDAAYDLGSSDKRWSTLYLSGAAKAGWLDIGGYTVITSARVLQNVSASTSIITSGQFPLARMPRGTAGYVLEAQGSAYDPMYVNPNGRYTPASHSHVAGDVTSGVFDEARIPTVFTNTRTFNGGIVLGSTLNMNSNSITNIATISQCMPPQADQGAVGTTSQYWNCIAGNSVWYKNLGQFDALDDLAIIRKIKGNGKTDERGMPLADPETLPPEVTENGLINAGALMGLLIGAVKQLAEKVEAIEKKLAERGLAS